MVERPDQEPPEAPGDAAPAVQAKGRASFAKLRRELSDEELASPAVQRMLLDDIERMEREVGELQTFRSRFHESDKECAVRGHKIASANSHEILYGMCLSMGSLSVGFAPAQWANQPWGWLSIFFGVVLVGGGIISKRVKT